MISINELQLRCQNMSIVCGNILAGVRSQNQARTVFGLELMQLHVIGQITHNQNNSLPIICLVKPSNHRNVHT